MSSKITITTNGTTTTATYGGKTATVENARFESFVRAAQSAFTRVTSVVKKPEPKQEPIKLYCVKDCKPGKYLTKDKVYELIGAFEKGSLTYDSGWTDEFSIYHTDAFSNGLKLKDCLVPLVKRPAKVGEYIVATNKDGHRAEINKPHKVGIVEFMGDRGIWVRVKIDCGLTTIREDQYLVLDGYQPEPEYYNGKVVCIEANKGYWGDTLEVGAIYRVEDGRFVHENGTKTKQVFTDVPGAKELFVNAKFIEYKGGAE